MTVGSRSNLQLSFEKPSDTLSLVSSSTIVAMVAMLDAHSERLPRHAPGLLEQFSEILSILSQAASAAHHCEELRRQCDAALAQRGLKRADLPRIAYYELTKGY